MSATRNNLPVSLGGISIQPVATPLLAPLTAPRDDGAPMLMGLGTAPQAPRQVTQAGADVQSTSVPLSQQVTLTNLNVPSLSSPTVPMVRLSPAQALQGAVFAPPMAPSSVTISSRPNPVARLTAADLNEDTLSLATSNVQNGSVTLAPGAFRPELVMTMPFQPSYDGLHQPTEFGRYLNDLYQNSILRDSLRKYLIANRYDALAQTLAAISSRVSSDITYANETIAQLDQAISRRGELLNALNVKVVVGDGYNVRTPYVNLRELVTTRMLFSDRSYSLFSDTKLIYQLLFDMSSVLNVCSFGLVSGFTDHDRTAITNNPNTNSQLAAQDAITLDLSYGSGLRFEPSLLRAKYMTDSAVVGSVVASLPGPAADKIQLITWFLSKELRVSKGLGKYLPDGAALFGFGNRGNPFDNVIGAVPTDIFTQPSGQNSLAGLFYLRNAGAQSSNAAVILPYESRAVVGDNETTYVPGSAYFGDALLRGDYGTFSNYKELFSTRISAARSVFDRLLLKQHSYDQTSAAITPASMIKSAAGMFGEAMSYIRAINGNGLSTLLFALYRIAASQPAMKFELFKLLLLVILYDSRPTVTSTVPNVDNFRRLLFDELSSNPIQGFAAPVTEDTLPDLLLSQISVVVALAGQNLPMASGRGHVTDLFANTPTSPIGKETGDVSPANNSMHVPFVIAQDLHVALRSPGQNLFKCVDMFARAMFAACGNGDVQYHLISNSSVTRYNGVTITGTLLLVNEMFAAMADMFTAQSVSFFLDGNSIVAQFNSSALSEAQADIGQFVGSNATAGSLLPLVAKVDGEELFIDNGLVLLERLNQSLNNVTSPTPNERDALATLGPYTGNVTVSYIRSAKSVLRSYVDRLARYNPSGKPGLNFYLPSGKAISDNTFIALQTLLKSTGFLGSALHELLPNSQLLTIGVPAGFVDSILSSGVRKADTAAGLLLQGEPSDIVRLKVYRTDKNNERLIFKPVSFMFDTSLFAYGFDGYGSEQLAELPTTTDALLDVFRFYDFDEDMPYTSAVPQTLSTLVNTDGYYSSTPARKWLAGEVVKNLMLSHLIGAYVNMATGMSLDEETFISYDPTEIRRFSDSVTALASNGQNIDGAAATAKLMTPEYTSLLSAFATNRADVKMMLTLCNDIRSTMFRRKDFDRTFSVIVARNRFPVDIESMNQTNAGREELVRLGRAGSTITAEDGEVYVVSDNTLVMDQYFVNIEALAGI